MRKRAFTLAEVLITLAIIGTIAAITLPSLMINTQTTELETRFKKTFADLVLMLLLKLTLVRKITFLM